MFWTTGFTGGREVQPQLSTAHVVHIKGLTVERDPRLSVNNSHVLRNACITLLKIGNDL